MPKSLTKIDEPDLFDYGKAITLILSKTKELGKTRNTLVDDILYLEVRKKQETEALERAIAKKAELAKLEAEVTKKIIDSKAAFMAEAETKSRELAMREANLTVAETIHTENIAKFEQSQQEQRNELELRSKDLTKQYDSALAAVKVRENDVVTRTEVLRAKQTAYDEAVLALEARENAIATKEKSFDGRLEDLNNQKRALDNREAAIIDKEAKLESQRQGLATLASDLEGQASLIQSEKHKNDTDASAVRDMQKMLYDKKAELDNREIHIRDRESTALTR